ncbi:BrnA antitoxin family protein [Lichenihabitans sp. Uapishka_5]|uniref:BrnA antitoxin family protein n=1 Tax=Lichenihabitans sp. Uapishka_5 TaxID=3037302 RepID=UPI0029E80702|nr:BrnA antitoxin family protein [Lichenihabitans sp. Uapishka_5]MDX7953579.1 BrnA antitoxin family protein [Lichenihabitans sp. Uapishka_5]
MTAISHAPGYVSNPDYTQEDWDEVCDSPELTADDFARMRPASEALPELVRAMRQRREALSPLGAAPFTLYVDEDVLEAYRATGPGWQGRMSEALRKAVGL